MIQAIGDSLAFRGRLTRVGYWRWQLTLVIIGAAITYGAVAVVMAGGPRWLSALVFAPMAIGVVVAVGVTARRLHDRGRGAVWLLLFIGAPWFLGAVIVLLGQAASIHASAGWAALGLSLGGFVIQLWAFVEVGLLRGAPGPNRFGPPPA